MSKRNAPRKRKIGAVTDEELMPPPQVPVSKKRKPSRQAVAAAIAAASSASAAVTHNVSIISDISNISNVSANQTQNKCGPLSIIFEKVQENEAMHTKFAKELTTYYGKMEHTVFMRFFLKGIRIWMKMEESNLYANTGLRFLAKYLSTLRCDDPDTITHPILRTTFDFLLKHISLMTTVRFRICQFVNCLLSSMSSEANIDDDIFDEILRYMSERMKDSSSAVRVQAVYALQRLQIPENPDDHVVRLYSYHLSNDPSVQVRQAILKSIGRNPLTVPIILERLWDVDERVRRTTYLQMSSHPVKNYKVAQRLMLLEQGLNDHSESVRKILHSVLLPQWLQSYNKQYLKLISALKLDANPEEIQRFTKITKKALHALFKNDKIDDLLNQLPLNASGEFVNCIPFNQLTVELAVFWLSIVEYLQQNDTNDRDNNNGDDDDDDYEDPLQHVICELSTFCEYLSSYINYMRDTKTEDSESWNAQENEYKLHILIEILMKFDLGDEIGRQNLNTFIKDVLCTQILGENVVQKLVHCVENLIPDTNGRQQYFIEIIRSIIEPSPSINFLDPVIAAQIDSIKDPDVNIAIVQLKSKIMELQEQEYEMKKAKNVNLLETVTEELASSTEEFLNILNSYATKDKTAEVNSTVLTSINSKKVSKEWILHCLEICFYTICSKCTISLSMEMFKLYADFVQPHMTSQHMEIRDRALKCGIAFSMLSQSLAKDVHEELYQQFVRHHQPRLWTTAVNGICELFDRYGIEHFAYDTDGEKTDGLKSKKTRQLYNVTSDADEQDDSQDTVKNGTNVMYLFGHLFDTCQEPTINMALTTGFCRLILGGHYETSELISKIILKFFNPTTCTEINQILSVFFETLIHRGKQACLEKALLPTITTILDAPHESPLREIKPDAVIKFVINSTSPCEYQTGPNIHNTIAHSFLKHMHEHLTNKEMVRVLSKELPTLDIDANTTVRDELKEIAESLLAESINDSKIEGYIKTFAEMMSGTLTKRPRSTVNLDDAGSDDDPESVDENVERNSVDDRTQSSQTKTATQPTAMDTSSSPVPSISSSIADQTKNSEDADASTAIPATTSPTTAQNSDNDSSDEENRAQTAATKKVKTSARNKKGTRNSKVSKELPDENENCRVVTSTQQQSDDEVIPNTPTASPVVANRNRRKAITSKRDESPKSPAQKSATPKSSTKSVEQETTPKSAAKKSSTARNSGGGRVKSTTPTTKEPLTTPERRKRHRLSQAHVQLDRVNVDKINNVMVHRTRNALVAEFKENNIMTRKRQSLDQIKSPTRRMEQLKKLTPTLSAASPTTVTNTTTSNTTAANVTTRTTTSSRNSSASSSKNSSPNVTPLPKRRSVSHRTSPIPTNLKLLSEKSAKTTAPTKATAQQRPAISKIPTRAASATTRSASSSRTASPTKNTKQQPSSSIATRKSSSPAKTITRSRLPLRKGNRSASDVTSRRK